MVRLVGVVLACVMVVGVTAAEPDATAEKYYAMAEFWVGDWKAEYDVVDEEAMEVMGGRKATADVSIKWSAEKKCHEVKIVKDGKMLRHALWGYDAKAKRWKGMGFNSDGSSGIAVHGPELLNAKWGNPYQTKARGVKADGTPVQGLWTTTLVDKDHYKVKICDLEDGKEKLLFTIKLTRKKK